MHELQQKCLWNLKILGCVAKSGVVGGKVRGCIRLLSSLCPNPTALRKCL